MTDTIVPRYDYWVRLTRCSTTGLTDEQVHLVAAEALASETRGEGAGVWHSLHTALKTPRCHCYRCAKQERLGV